MATVGDSPSLPLLSQTVGSTSAESATISKTDATAHQLQGREVSPDLRSCGPTAEKTSQATILVKIPPPPPPPRPPHLRGKLISPSSPALPSAPTPPPLPTSRPQPRTARPTSSPTTPSTSTSSTASSQRPTRKPGEKPPQPSTPRPTPPPLLDHTRLAQQVKARAGEFVGQARGAAMQAGVRVAETADMVKGGVTTVATAVEEGARQIGNGAVVVTNIAREIFVSLGEQIQQLKFLGKGKAKEVFELDDRMAVYVPTSRKKAPELRYEAEYAAELQEDLIKKNKRDLASCLMKVDPITDDKEKAKITTTLQAKRRESIGDVVAYKTEKGLKDAAGLAKDSFDYGTNKLLIQDVLKGMCGMHSTNKVHGDLKTENIMIYQDKNGYSAKVCDFGKVRRLGPNATAMHTGNPRFAPPEGVLSQKGEVYSTAIVMLSILESEILNQDEVNPEAPASNASASSKQRWGVEKFLVDTPACPQGEVLTLRGKISIYGRGIISAFIRQPSPASLKAAQIAVHDYIDQQIDKLEGKEGYDLKELEGIRKLLKSMTDADPSQRPTMEEALQVYNAILSKPKT